LKDLEIEVIKRDWMESERRKQIKEFIKGIKCPEVHHPGFSTLVNHAGQEPEPIHGSINVPIHMVSTFKQKEPMVPTKEHMYTRVNNPTIEAFDKCIAASEYGKYARSYASGIAAVYAVFSTFQTGDHLIVCDEVYGGTTSIVKQIFEPCVKLEIDFVNMQSLDNIRKHIKPNTKLIWMETPSNPLLTITDIEAIAAIGKEKGILTGIDNTFATPYLQSPLLLGVDISVHAVTKYIGGHCDIIAGVLVTNNKQFFDNVFMKSWIQGNNSNPMNSYLALRGLKTLKIRMDEHCRSGWLVAHFLKQHKNVEKVFYPGLEEHPHHEIAKKQMRGFGGMVSFRLKGGDKETRDFFKKLHYFILGFSLGGAESLCEHPATMTHGMLCKEEREAIGITDNLVRLSVGLEDIEDLLEDLDQALDY